MIIASEYFADEKKKKNEHILLCRDADKRNCTISYLKTAILLISIRRTNNVFICVCQTFTRDQIFAIRDNNNYVHVRQCYPLHRCRARTTIKKR